MADNELRSLVEETAIGGKEPARLAIDVRLHGQKAGLDAPGLADVLFWQPIRQELRQDIQQEIRAGFLKAAVDGGMKGGERRRGSWLRGALTFALCAAVVRLAEEPDAAMGAVEAGAEARGGADWRAESEPTPRFRRPSP